MSDVEQLVEVIRQIDLIVEDVRKMQEDTPMPLRDDLFYSTVQLLAEKYDELQRDKDILIKRIPEGAAFVAWLASRH